MSNPAFNVVIPFRQILTIQMNREMAELFVNFISEVDEVESDVDDLREDLDVLIRSAKPTIHDLYSLTKLNEIYIVNIVNDLSNILIEFIHDVDQVEPQLVALSKALSDPETCYNIRLRKREPEVKPRTRRVRTRTCQDKNYNC